MGEIQELSMSSVTDKKSFIKNAVQVGISVFLVALAAGNPLAITPSFGMDDTDHESHVIQGGRAVFEIENDDHLNVRATTETHEKEWSKNDSTSLSIAPITEAFNLYQGIQKARSLYADIQKKYEERLEQALPKNVITHAIETEEEFIKKINETPDVGCFVCSDDPATEKKFLNACPSVRVFPKQHYVEMLVPNGNWGYEVTDSTGHRFPFNVKRGSESVLEAMVDLLILSKSNIINTDHRSTFIRTAVLLSGGDLTRKYSQ